MIDGGIDLDLDAVRQNIGEAQVICLFFPTLRRTLLVDTRVNEHAGTFIKVVPIARNSSDRLRSLKHLRPLFGRPDSMTLIPWEGRIDSLLSLDVWQLLVDRLDDASMADACLARLRHLERREQRAAILGKRYETLWMRAVE